MVADQVRSVTSGISPQLAANLAASPILGLLGGGFAAEIVGRLAQGLGRAVTEFTGRGRGSDRYVTPGTNWDGFSHKTLFRMVHQEANPAQVERLADDWGRQGTQLAERAEELQRSLARLLPYWQGEASEQAARSVIKAVGWIGDTGATTSAMSNPLQDSAGALRSAQATMPAPPDGGGWIAGAGGGAAVGMAVGGPAGAAIGAAIGGIASAFGFGSNKKKLKRRAVQTMQRYEAAGVQVDTTAPQFVDSGVGRIGQSAYDEYLANSRRVPPPNPGVTPVPGGNGPISGTPGFTPAPVNPVGVVPGVPGHGPITGGPGGGPVGGPGGLPGGGGPGGGFGPGRPFLPGFGGVPPGLGGVGTGPRGGGPGGASWRNLTGRGLPGGFLGGRPGFGPGGGFGAPGAIGGGGLGGGTTRRSLLGPGGRLGAALLDGPDGAARRAGAGAGAGRAGAGFGAAGLPGGGPGAAGRTGGSGAGGRAGAGAGAGAGARAGAGAGGRAGGAGAAGRAGAGGASPLMPGAGARGEDDNEHRRRYPYEEEPFKIDAEVAPPVIGA